MKVSPAAAEEWLAGSRGTHVMKQLASCARQRCFLRTVSLLEAYCNRSLHM